MEELDLFKRENLSKISESFPEAVYIMGSEGIITYVNPTFEFLTGFSSVEIVGLSARILNFDPEATETKEMWDAISEGKVWGGQVLLKRKKGSAYQADLTIFPILTLSNQITNYVVVQHGTVSQLRGQNETLQRIEEYAVLHAVAKTLQKPISLKKMLKASLEEIVSFNEFKVESKAGIFLADQDKKVLRLFSTVGDFSQDFLDMEKEVPFGECLCGRAAASGEMLVSNSCFSDPRHERKYPGMSPHGHFIVPLKSKEKMLGVLFLYTSPDPSWYERSPEILLSIGGLIGDAIVSYKRGEQILENNKQLKELNELKNKFLGIASHDLRNPLYVIRTLSEILKGESVGAANPKQKDLLGKIFNASNFMQALLENLLDISKIESGKIELNKKAQDLNLIVRQQVELSQLLAEKKKIILELKLEDLPPISFDESAITQVIGNFIGNAIKFSPFNTKIIITIENQGENIKFSVCDEGPGISEEDQKLLFKEFQTLSAKPTGGEKSTGLGLAITQKLIHLHSGQVGVKSQLGGGSTFFFTLPLQEP
jgi:PAS domain S-box-containing protein